MFMQNISSRKSEVQTWVEQHTCSTSNNGNHNQIAQQMVESIIINQLHPIVKGIRSRKDNIYCLLGDQITGFTGLKQLCAR